MIKHLLRRQHGMGMPSVGILLHEMIKLMYHARVKNPTFFRLGTCGGIGIDGGNLVITERAVDGMMNPYLEQVSLRSGPIVCCTDSIE